MKDQVDGLVEQDVPAAYVNSTLDASEQRRRLHLAAAGGLRLLYVAPERLRSQRFQTALAQVEVSLLAVDEAHCISHWGHDFRPDYLYIADARRRMGSPPTLALTATATSRVQDEIVSALELRHPARIVTGFNRPNLTFEVRATPSPAAKLRALQSLLGENDDAGIIYTGTRRAAEEVALFVQEMLGQQAAFYHAGLPADRRTDVQERFMAGDLQLVVATNAFGMGIDRPDLRFVIHYNLPGTLEAYYQQAGRAGRDGLPARCVLLYSPKDRALQEWFIENDASSRGELKTLHTAVTRAAQDNVTCLSWKDLALASGLHQTKVRVGLSQLEQAAALIRLGDEGTWLRLEVMPLGPQRLRQVTTEIEALQEHKRAQLACMIAYAESNDCRRRIILDHFGDSVSVEAPRCCDNCLARAASAAAEEKRRMRKVKRTKRQSPAEVKRLLQEVVAMGEVGSPDALPVLIEALRHENGNVRRLAASALGKIGDPRAVQPLLGCLDDEKPQVRQYAITALGRIGDVAAIMALQRVLADPDEKYYNHRVARTALKRIQARVPDVIEAQVPEEAECLILQCVADLPHRLPRSGAARLLVGSSSKRVEAYRTHPLFGRLSGLRRSAVMQQVDRLIERGWLRLDDHRYLALTPARQEALARESEVEATDPIADFLTRPHPRSLDGPWDAGWALDFHSRFVGARQERSETGELVYRFKYQGERALCADLANRLAVFIHEHPELAQVEAVVPVPPSLGERAYQPVPLLAATLAERLHRPALLDALVKTRPTRPQKDMRNLAAKRTNVAGTFAVRGDLRGKRLLVLDDLLDSGATLSEVTYVLQRAGAVYIAVLTLTKTIHTDQ
jgi:ATP-dependent DNA helicase RecQ